MPTKILDLQNSRAGLLQSMREINDAADAESRGLSAEEQTNYEKLEKDFEDHGRSIKRHLDFEAKEKELSERSDASLDGRMLGGDGDTRSAAETGNWFINTDEYRNALVDYLRHGDQDMRAEGREALTKGKRELRDQAKGTNTLGGFLVPIDFQKKLALHAVQSGTMRMNRAGQGALVTGTGEALQIPKTTVYGQAEWVSEGSPSTSDDSSFGQLTLNAFTARRLVKVSVELVEDNAVDLVGHLSKAIGQSIGRLENTAYWNGSGTGQPTGLITALQTIGTAAKGKVGATGQTTSITADDILDLFYSVGPQYRINGEWALNDMTVKAVRKLKDATGNYLFSTTPGVGGSLAYSAPDTLQGKPLWSDPDIPQMASNAWSVVFGDMSAYQLRDVGVAGPEATERPVGAFSVIRLNERFMDGLQIGFLGYHRTDGGLIDQTGAIKAYVNSAT